MNVNLIVLLFLSQLIYVELKENNTNTTTNSSEMNTNETIPEIMELYDSNFDQVIQNGNNNRWLILFYLQTCYHCYRARTVLNRILELRDYKVINNIKFASVEVGINTKCDVRFNISGVPYIILVENNTMYELELYANEKNLIRFIETDFKNVTNELKPFPHMNILKYYYTLFYNSINYAAELINNFLNSKNINFKFTALTLFLSYILLCFAFCFSIIYLATKCTNSQKNNKIKNNSEKKNENNDDEKKVLNENNNINDNEEIRKMKEDKKEEEINDKKIEKEIINKDNNKEKKKKKE